MNAARALLFRCAIATLVLSAVSVAALKVRHEPKRVAASVYRPNAADIAFAKSLRTYAAQITARQP
ncbi:MAG: hypothetical protein ACRC9K_12375 [Afipia sp.]